MTTIERAESAILHTYNRFQIVLDKGDGVYLYDDKGKKYLDFGSGIGVYALGYNVKELNDAMKNQIDKITHVSNLFYNEPAANAAESLVEVSGMDKVFFTNSGAEAIEGAVKSALKYWYNKTGKTDGEIIAIDHSFHGRTCGALAVTGKESYRAPFSKMLGDVKFAVMNDIDSVNALVSSNTAAIIMETVQGEGGIYPATKEFIESVYKLCHEKDILLILDEIQCGMGRTGYMYAWQQYDIRPDIVTTAKALGNGFPVGAFMLTNRVADSALAPGDHGTTYGGNPLAGAAVAKVIKLFKTQDIVLHVRAISPYLEEKLGELASKYPNIIRGRRGMGLMQGLVLNVKPGDVVNKGLEAGLITLTAGEDVLRLLPPLIIEKKHVDELVSILDGVFGEMG